MNKRIRELMINAGYAAPELAGRANKLVELIIRECVEQVFYTIENEEEDNISLSIRNRIKEHFGVKE